MSDYDRDIDLAKRDANAAKLQRAIEQADHLKSLYAKKCKLLDELSRALAIDVIWPGSICHDKPIACHWIGPTGRLRLRICRHDGESREFKAANIPDDLRRILNYPRTPNDFLRTAGRIDHA